ncbi:MAG: peptidase C1 [Bacteroidetes bacterium]|nr:MAG: peptidase C1 [Bacteroidota bacterium]
MGMIENFKIKKADGKVISFSGYKKNKKPLGAKKFAKKSEKKLPSKVDMRKDMTAVESQGETNSCVANATAGAYEYLMKRHLGDDAYDVSRLFIYYNGRYFDVDEGDEIEDEGTFVESAINGLKEYGACSENMWDFDEDLVNDEPSEEAYEEAKLFLIEDTELIPLELEAWQSALAEGYPIIFGISTFNSFDSHKKKGLIPVPTKNESGREEHGGHAMLCVGYSNKDEVFIVRNSWGEEWGDEGYCYIPYKYMMNPEWNDGDSWIIKRIEEIEPDEESWSEDDESILGDYESELANMSDEDYSNMLDAMGDYPLEYRIALLFLHAADTDGEISEDELQEISNYLANSLEALGSEYEATEVLEYCQENIDKKLVKETIKLLGEYLSTEMLATMVKDLEEVVGVDDLEEAESDFINELIDTWQVNADEDEEQEDEEEEEEE